MCHSNNGDENSHPGLSAYHTPHSVLVLYALDLLYETLSHQKASSLCCKQKRICFEAHDCEKWLFRSGITPQIS